MKKCYMKDAYSSKLLERVTTIIQVGILAHSFRQIYHIILSPIAKFNDSLQETFNDSDDCVTTVTVTPAITVTPTAAIVPTAMTITPDISVDLKSGNKTQEVGSISYYVLAVLGGGIMILSLSVMILCIAIGIHWQVAKRKSIGDQSIDVQHRDNGRQYLATLLIFFIGIILRHRLYAPNHMHAPCITSRLR